MRRSMSLAGHDEFQKLYAFVRVIRKCIIGTLYLAIDRQTGAEVAVKVVSESIVGPQEFQLATKEMHILKALSEKSTRGVPSNIKRLIRVLFHRPHLYLVCEYVKGGDILTTLERITRYSNEHARAIMTSLVSGVAFIHSKGIAHRDLKLENILLQEAGDTCTSIKIGMQRIQILL
jgi:serine/threonine protein kinase